jgi:twitching motility protein PilT
MMDIIKLLQLGRQRDASDLHLVIDSPPLLRIHGALQPMEDMAPLTAEDIDAALQQVATEKQRETFQQCFELDFGRTVPEVGRVRFNAARQRGTTSLVNRLLPPNIPTPETLGLPEVCKELVLRPRGMVVISGPTGSGKSTTLASMIDYLNQKESKRVVTMEDPIEYTYENKKCTITQRELGADTLSFSEALRHVLRQDPDVILVGELRDAESMEIALRGAETGHLVMSTVHTTDAKETIGRFIDTFPAGQQRQVRIQLAFNLRAVISQRLLDRADGKGLVLASEIMTVNAAIRSYILETDKLGEIVENIAKGREQYGMQTFDQAILDLYSKGLISLDEALANATSSNDMRLKLRLEEHVELGPKGL